MTEDILNILPTTYRKLINIDFNTRKLRIRPLPGIQSKWELFCEKQQNNRSFYAVYLLTDFCKENISEKMIVYISTAICRPSPFETLDILAESFHVKNCSDLNNMCLLKLDISLETKHFLFPHNSLTLMFSLDFRQVPITESRIMSKRYSGLERNSEKLKTTVDIKVGKNIFKSIDKSVLSSASKIFKQKFKAEPEIQCIEFFECKESVFLHFIDYLYGKTIEDVTPEVFASLYGLSVRYEIRRLQEECEDIYKNNPHKKTLQPKKTNVSAHFISHDETESLKTDEKETHRSIVKDNSTKGYTITFAILFLILIVFIVLSLYFYLNIKV